MFKKNILLIALFTALLSANTEIEHLKCGNANVKLVDYSNNKQALLINGKSVKIDNSMIHDMLSCQNVNGQPLLVVRYGNGMFTEGYLHINPKTLQVKNLKDTSFLDSLERDNK